ncbi:MAG TPA: ABC transporter ATP-binding protein [Elusimicrobiota bacterium]|nr:ABC transporter ATP-binding protein [Elusimicrobiota bacterium]
MILEVAGLTKSFDERPVLDGISLQVEAGEFVVLIGPNGCGKTVFLKILSGLIPPSSGRLRLAGPTTMAFQRSPLFPWMTVRENLLISLNDPSFRGRAEREVAAWLEESNLSRWADFYPHQISGGMRQKVNVIRSLMSNPPLVLMDEPFASLDYLERRRLQTFVSRLQLAKKTSLVFVTHDIPEAIFLADRILVMSGNGKIETDLRCPLPRPREHETLPREAAYPDLYEKLSKLLSGN